jgi:hypothetical protein
MLADRIQLHDFSTKLFDLCLSRGIRIDKCFDDAAGIKGLVGIKSQVGAAGYTRPQDIKSAIAIAQPQPLSAGLAKAHARWVLWLCTNWIAAIIDAHMS